MKNFLRSLKMCIKLENSVRQGNRVLHFTSENQLKKLDYLLSFFLI